MSSLEIGQVWHDAAAKLTKDDPRRAEARKQAVAKLEADFLAAALKAEADAQNEKQAEAWLESQRAQKWEAQIKAWKKWSAGDPDIVREFFVGLESGVAIARAYCEHVATWNGTYVLNAENARCLPNGVGLASIPQNHLAARGEPDAIDSMIKRYALRGLVWDISGQRFFLARCHSDINQRLVTPRLTIMPNSFSGDNGKDVLAIFGAGIRWLVSPRDLMPERAPGGSDEPELPSVPPLLLSACGFQSNAENLALLI
ncbi:MAG: hypothetical protein NTY53_18575 [Kiritimatiellaeota bacterium]|nr:hypothetical protein [Kiritimatiellota bacterium]